MLFESYIGIMISIIAAGLLTMIVITTLIMAINEMVLAIKERKNRTSTLSIEEMKEAVLEKDRKDIFISGTLNKKTGVLSLTRPDFSTVKIHVSSFRVSPKTTADFNRFKLIDYGQTLKFGEYEADAGVVERMVNDK